ncbi:MAG: alpha/beta hydrolase family protein [Tenuifilaceae bacterium]
MKTKLFSKLVAVIFAVTTLFYSNYTLSQTNQQNIEGSWLGALKVQGIELRIVFNISLDKDNKLKSTLDSPDQGAKGIPLGKTILDGSKLTIEASNMMASYNGEIVNDTTINGTWTQAGNSYPLNIVKQKKALVLNRPQEPKPPYDYISEDVTIESKRYGTTLAGTLTLPKGNGPFPAVLLITGSGLQNRDEEIFGHKPFLVIADYLTKRGFAVLRCDDRGAGKSKGNLKDITTYDLSTDARASVDFLLNDKRIDPKKVGLLGHSEGGLIALMLASEKNDIAFIVSLAGPGVTGKEILLEQSAIISKLMEIPEKEIKSSTELNKKIYSILEKELDNQIAQQKINKSLKDYLTKQKEKDIEQKVKEMEKGLPITSYSWLRYFITSDPSTYLVKIQCPVLAMNGGKDVQVISQSNLAAIDKFLKKGKNNDVTTIEVKDLNHLFQHCTTGLPSEYGKIEETFSEDALKTIGDWLSKRFLK